MLPLVSMAAAFLLLWQGCSNNGGNDITEITLTPQGQNALKVKVAIQCTDTVDAAVEYWPKGKEEQRSTTGLSTHQLHHAIVLTNLQAAQSYEYRVLTGHGKALYGSKVYSFNTNDFPMWMKDVFNVVCPDSTVLPASFRQGYVMISAAMIPAYCFY